MNFEEKLKELENRISTIEKAKDEKIDTEMIKIESKKMISELMQLLNQRHQ